MNVQKYISSGKLWLLMERRTANGRPSTFDIEFRKYSTGELVKCRAHLSSWHSDGLTVNIVREGERHPIKIYRCLITKFNNVLVL